MVKTILAAIALLFPLAASPAWAAYTENNGALNFAVYRDDSEIGTHTLIFHKNGGSLDVSVKTDIAVKLPIIGITVYRFEHEGHETWTDGHLTALQSKTNEDGTPHHLSVHANGAGLSVDGDGRTGESKPSIIPASLWREDLVRSSVLLNTLDGREMSVTVNEKGTEEVMVGNTPVEARHFVISGELEREVWYDANQRLVKVRFVGNDGSTITYLLK